MENKISSPNITLQQKISNYLTNRIKNIAVNKGLNIEYKTGYILNVNKDMLIDVPDENKKYGLKTVTFTPISYSDFATKRYPIGSFAESGTINVTMILSDISSDNNITNNLEVINEFLVGLVGANDDIDNFQLAFNTSDINQDSAPEIYEGTIRTFISFSIYFIATTNLALGNTTNLTINDVKIETLDLNTTRAFLPETSQIIGDNSTKTLFKDATWEESIVIILNLNEPIIKELLNEIEESETSNKSYLYKKDYGNGIIFEKKVGVQGGSIQSKPGTFQIMTIIFKEVK